MITKSPNENMQKFNPKNASTIIRQWGPLLLTSSLSLFFELAVIRWLSAEIRMMAYYKNLILLAAFLGLSIGFILVRHEKEYRYQFPRAWTVFVALVILLGVVLQGRQLIYPGGADEVLWQNSTASYWALLISFISLVLIFFLMTMFLFIPLGQMVGKEMAQHAPIPAYILNIIASLVGVWVFSILSFFNTPPVVWFGLALAGIAAVYAWQKQLKPTTLVLFAISLVGIGIFSSGKLWSPYNRLNLDPLSYTNSATNQEINMGYVLDVQGTFYMSAMDLRPESIQAFKQFGSQSGGQEAEETAFAYELPYRLAQPGSRVLVVGSGMGNDLAAALRMEMGQVDAVDIDPLIIRLGTQYHPEKPYSDPRVTAIEADARAFFSRPNQPYDLVVFGLLDSHTLLSGMSSVRLDSFVYTIDSFRQAKSLLKQGGYATITFATTQWIEERLGRMMGEVFGPENVFVFRSVIGTHFVLGSVPPETQTKLGLTLWQPDPANNNLPLATDDWPYLYLRTRTIPSGYWQSLLVIILVCLALIARSFPEALRPNWHFWLLGAAFLLVEFKAITELALLFGTTWFVNSLAISGVLVMALLANLFVLTRKQINLTWVYICLFAAIALGYFVPLNTFAALPEILKAVLSTALLTSPLFFSGIIFSESLRRAGETAGPLASNFSGSAAGGLLEYSSSLWGIKSMYLLAAVVYLAAFLTSLRQKK